MKLQDILIPIGLAYITMLVFSYFWSPKESGEQRAIRPGQEFTVKQTAQMCYPVNTEIDFYDAHKETTARIVDVQGYNAELVFSTAGGALESFIFKRDLAGVEGTIATLTPPAQGEREKGVFLVAFDEMTPFNFTLIDTKKTDDATHIRYESSTVQAKITKEFIVSTKTYKIDVVLTIEPLNSEMVLKPRIFMPGPVMQDFVDQEKRAGVVFDVHEKLQKLTTEKTVDALWAAPKIFGVEDRYFLYALVNDADNFTQRAFFKRSEHNQLTAIFEGPEIKEKTTWKLSFYCGPKELHELAAVDNRLEPVMDYGWFAIFSKPLLMLLILIYGYVGNYGWAIIIITILMRLVLLPFTRGSQRNMKRGSHDYAQKMKHIEQKFRHDPVALEHAKMELAKKQGFSALSGCLPLLLQIPVFIGLNFALRNAIELYRAPFIFWIKDLSARDPYYVIPACLALTVFLAMSAQAKDPRHKVAIFFGALVTAGLTANISAGLGLFLALSGFLGVMQTRATHKIA